MTWFLFEDANFHIRLPRPIRVKTPGPLKKTGNGQVFRGKLVLEEQSQECDFLIAVDLKPISTAIDASLQTAAREPLVNCLQNGQLYHYAGKSRLRPGGSEIASTMRNPLPYGESHDFSIVFPIGLTWNHIRIVCGWPGVDWNAFYGLCAEIVNSFERT